MEQITLFLRIHSILQMKPIPKNRCWLKFIFKKWQTPVHLFLWLKWTILLWTHNPKTRPLNIHPVITPVIFKTRGVYDWTTVNYKGSNLLKLTSKVTQNSSWKWLLSRNHMGQQNTKTWRVVLIKPLSYWWKLFKQSFKLLCFEHLEIKTKRRMCWCGKWSNWKRGSREPLIFLRRCVNHLHLANWLYTDIISIGIGL